MEIPADGIVLSASELTTDESAMTGETGNDKGEEEKRDKIN
jgi:magnesium-transporting ATPase (P-type)